MTMLNLKTEARWKALAKVADHRIQCHAKQYEHLAPILIKAVRELADPGSCYENEYNNRLTASGWASFGGRRCWIGPDRSQDRLVIRKTGKGGKILVAFDNDATEDAVRMLIKLHAFPDGQKTFKR
jgi:hypothetical protein